MGLVPTRRSVLHGGIAASATVAVAPAGALAAPLGPDPRTGASRESRVTRLVHADLHNHSPGTDVPQVVHVEEARLIAEPRGSRGDGLIRFSWTVLRVADPSRSNDEPGLLGHPCNTLALAYTSPWRFGHGPDVRPGRPGRRPRVLTNGSGRPHHHEH